MVCARMNGYLSGCTCVCMRTCVYACICACMYILQYPPTILKLASLALPPPPPPSPILKSFLRLCYMYSMVRNLICEYWDITSSQHTIGLSGHHRPANLPNILMASVGGPIEARSIWASSPEYLFRVKDQVIYQLACSATETS